MFNPSWRLSLGACLLGIACICLLGASPLAPLLPMPPFPGGQGLALLLGLFCLLASLLCLALNAWHARKPSCTEDDRWPEEQLAMHQTLLTRFPDLVCAQELETWPRWWLRALAEHVEAGREETVRQMLAEWHETLQACSGEEGPVCACCGLTSPPAHLRLCAQCQQAVHYHCSAQVRRAYRLERLLVVDPRLQPLCWLCLDRMQLRGWHLSRQGERWLLLRQRSRPDLH